MTQSLVIALDAMGGDRAPNVVVGGAALARERYPGLSYLMFGDEAKLKPLLARHKILNGCVTVHHTSEAVRNEDKPTTALRNGRQSSMRLAIEAVSEGKADCIVSAGNTGALMAMSKVVLKTSPGIDRPAIASFFPTRRGESCMLDLGANVQCDANNLVEFAVMGEAFASTILGIEKPTIGLLNVGTEEVKGSDELRKAAATLRSSNLPIEFKGFIEGDDIAKGTVDVVVTDGFTGNVALKAAEGTAKLIVDFLSDALRANLMAKIGLLFARRAIRNLRVRTDPRRYNGAIFLGLDGIVIKSHGGTDALGFANAIGVGADLVLHGFYDKMKHDFARLKEDRSTQQAAVS